MSEKNKTDGLYAIADAIDGLRHIADAISDHSKSIDKLTQTIRWSFMTDDDENVADGLGMINNRLDMFNTLIEEAGKLLGIANKNESHRT